MFIANNKDLVMFDTMVDSGYGMGPVCYDSSNYITRYGLFMPLGPRGMTILDMIKSAPSEEALYDLDYVKRFINDDGLLNSFYLDYEGRAYIVRYNGRELFKVPLPVGSSWVVLGSLDMPECTALNNVLYGREMTPTQLRDEIEVVSTIRILRPETIVKSFFSDNKPHDAAVLPNISMKWEKKKQ